MHHQHTAEEISPGDVVTYQPDPAPGMPARATVYALAADDHEGLLVLRAIAFTSSSWPHLYLDRLAPAHPVTIARPQWATLGDRMMSHIIDSAAGEHTTWCETDGAAPMEADQMPARPLCRSCGYRAAKHYEHLADPFTYRLPEDGGPL